MKAYTVVQRRPSIGTTVSIYGFHELSFDKWNILSMYLLVGNIAIVNLQVSFSIRDDQGKKVIMIISKPHKPIEIFKSLYRREVSFNNVWYIENVNEDSTKFCAFIGLANTKLNARQYIFLNNRPVHCPLILQVISTAFITILRSSVQARSSRRHQIRKNQAIFILLFISCRDYIFTVEKGKKVLILPSIQDLLLSIRNEILNIFTKSTMPLFDRVSKNVGRHKNSIYSYANNTNNITTWVPLLHETTIDKQNVSLLCYSDLTNINSVNTQSISQLTRNEITDVQLFTPDSRDNKLVKETYALTLLSEWSNWTHPDNGSNRLKKTNNFDSTTLFHKHYDFLPKKLHKLLCGNTKLTKTDVLIKSGGSVTSIPDTLLHHEMVVRPCKAVQRLREFRLKKELLEFVEILGQVRNEFIVGLAIQNDWKVLLLMDQHAIHERIRYENLLHKYKSQTRNQLLSTKLRDPIVIQLPVDKCNLLISNKIQLKRFGISFIAINDSTMAVHTVPECLKKDRYYDEVKLKFNLQSLLNEILQYFTKDKHHGLNDLPHTIHNAIAMEACHGAIKFGDPLTLQQCKWLLKLLKKTKIPTRCAHGRPSVVPILELSELDKWNKKSCQKDLECVYIKREEASNFYAIIHE
ncbi:DNA mismatch repair protein Mlh3 [Dufourea novaeangliae]|uniref:DNA mismatch repair protein Mlh3 n=1 Tax=Dufourea novaeangliae TaxID=178035 RepID=A0A154P8D4_DUFNO|nr:DNA mismatch repair protein Mlh3 [Dufourea novaeangliae]